MMDSNQHLLRLAAVLTFKLLDMVEVDGFEPTTLCVQSRCSTRLSYTPI